MYTVSLSSKISFMLVILKIFTSIWRRNTILYIFFLWRFSFTDSDNSQNNRGREGAILYFTLPLPPDDEHSVIYLQLCTRDDYHMFLIATLVFTRLLLDEIYHLIELLFDWLMMWCWFLFIWLLNWF